MTNPLDGNGVCKRCRGSGDINPVATCPDCDGTGRSPAPSQTAVEPVAAELAMLVNWLPKLIAALGSKPEHVDDVARLARVHALIPTLTAQAAALVAAEAERDQARADYEAATQSHLDHVLDLDIAMNGDGAAKRPLLIDIKLWLLEFIARAEAAETEVATLKARIAELEAALEDVFRLNDECSGSEPSISVLMRAIDDLRARRLTHQEKNNGR